MITLQRRGIVDTYSRFAFTRGSLAYDSKGRLYHHHRARFESGKFGQAVMVEEGMTNLLSNPSFETDSNTDGLADNWFLWVRGTGDSSRTHSYTRPAALFHGAYSQRIEITAASNTNASALSYTPYPSVTPGVTYTFSIYGRASVAGKVKISISWKDSSGATISETSSSGLLGTATSRLFVTSTAPSNTAMVMLNIFGINAVGEWFEVDAAQFEAKAYPTSWHDSTRSPETLTIPTAGVLNPQEGTVEFWFYVPIPTSNMIYIFDCYGGSNNNRILIYGASNALEALVGNGATYVITPTVSCQAGWNYIALRYGSFGVKLTVNSTTVSATGITKGPNTLATNAYLGSSYLGNDQAERPLYDDLRISSIARSDAEIAAAYASGQPLPVDQYTTLKLDFDGPDAQRGARVITL